MFARIVKFSPVSQAGAQFIGVLQNHVLRMIKAQEGCITALVQPAQPKTLHVIGISIWESKSFAERFHRECYMDIEQLLRPLLQCDPTLYTFEFNDTSTLLETVASAIPSTFVTCLHEALRRLPIRVHPSDTERIATTSRGSLRIHGRGF